MPECRILSDSTCDFSVDQAEELGVGIVPFHVTDESGVAVPGAQGPFSGNGAHEFYDRMRAGTQMLTSQPSQLEFEEVFEEVLESGESAVLFCISTGISGGYNGAMTAYERMHENHPNAEAEIFIIDTLVTSTPMFLLVEEACRRRDIGWPAERIATWARGAISSLQTFFMVDNLEALHHGGRIPKSVAVVGDKLDVKPMLTFDKIGRLSVVDVARGRKKGLRKLAANYFKKHVDDECGPVVAIGNADCPEDAEKLKSLILDECPTVRVLESSIGPTIGTHVGANMISCCFWGASA